MLTLGKGKLADHAAVTNPSLGCHIFYPLCWTKVINFSHSSLRNPFNYRFWLEFLINMEVKLAFFKNIWRWFSFSNFLHDSWFQVPQVESDGGKQTSSFVQEFTLRWEPHDARVSESMLKFWERRLFLDVSLMASNSKTIQAHRLVLCACSPLFEALLAGDEMSKHSHPMLCFNQIDYEHLYSLVEFMYRGTMTVTQETLPLIMKSAKILRIHGLTLGKYVISFYLLCI